MSPDWKAIALRSLMLLTAFACTMPLISRIAHAKAPPADPCTVLPATELNAVLGQQFGPPATSPMAAAVANGVTGTQCRYVALGGSPRTVTLVIYFDRSDAEAATNLAPLSKLFHPTKTLTGFADTVYLDSGYAVHAREGRARYYINIAPIGTYTPQAEKNLTDLTAYVAAQVK
jgi:hypothetical protein